MLLLNNVTRCPLVEGKVETNSPGQERSWREEDEGGAHGA